jgi:hypothetical protein
MNMKSLLIAIVLVMVLSVPVMAEEFTFTVDNAFAIESLNHEFATLNDWDEFDSTLEWTNIILTIIDTSYTLRGARFAKLPYVSFEDGYEGNPLIGKTPSEERIVSCMVFWALFRLCISKSLPEKWRTVWQSSNILTSLYCVNGWREFEIAYHNRGF